MAHSMLPSYPFPPSHFLKWELTGISRGTKIFNLIRADMYPCTLYVYVCVKDIKALYVYWDNTCTLGTNVLEAHVTRLRLTCFRTLVSRDKTVFTVI